MTMENDLQPPARLVEQVKERVTAVHSTLGRMMPGQSMFLTEARETISVEANGC